MFLYVSVDDIYVGACEVARRCVYILPISEEVGIMINNERRHTHRACESIEPCNGVVGAEVLVWGAARIRMGGTEVGALVPWVFDCGSIVRVEVIMGMGMKFSGSPLCVWRPVSLMGKRRFVCVRGVGRVDDQGVKL